MFKFLKDLLKFLVILFIFENGLTYNFDYNSVNTAETGIYLQHISNEVLYKRVNRLTVVQSVRNRRAKYFFVDVLNEFSKNLNDTKLMIKEVNTFYKCSFDYVNIMLIDTYESFEKMGSGPAAAVENFSEYYIIVYYSINDNPENEIQKIFNYCWQFYTVNVVLLLKTDEETTPIKLYTYYPFTQKSCKNAQMQIINQSKSILQLKESEIFPNKFKSFYNCTVMAALWNATPYITLPALGSETKEIDGFEGYLLRVLSEILQFRIDYIIPPNNEQRGVVGDNGNLTGALKMLADRSADLSLGSFRCTLARSTVSTPSITFYQTMQVFTVLNLRQPWSSLEIIVFPFQFHIWIIIMLLFIFLLSFPWILKSYLPKALRFIYGFRSISYINNNFLATALNQCVKFLPKRNFARFILLMWILLTMIIRSIYHGALYKFLTMQQNKALPDSVEDLIKQQYKLIINLATNNTFSDIPVIRNKLIEVLALNISDVGGFNLLECNPDKRYVTGSPKDFLTYYASTHNKYDKFHILKETIFAQQLCIYFTKHSYLKEPVDRVLESLGNFGLIEYWASRLMLGRSLRQFANSSIKTALTWSQLSGIFQICAGLYVIALIVFLWEYFLFKFKK